jgi:poly(A) polymerase
LIDYAGGLPDLEQRWVRMIGEPHQRLQEDPIRILRALRLKHMIGFSLDPLLRAAMQEQAGTLTSTVLPRRREEILKLLRLKNPDCAFLEAQDLGVLKYLSPTMAAALESSQAEVFIESLHQLGSVQKNNGNPAELFGLLVHAYVRSMLQSDPSSGPETREALDNEAFQTWMRDELGMFKFEQALAVKALHVEPLLARRKDFQRKGERRQRALITNDAFPMALKFADRDYCLSAEDLLYWNERHEALKAENPLQNVRHKRRRPRRSRRGNSGRENRKSDDNAKTEARS